ncbi:hypothetical protein JL720_14031 [Aureococcus anophagefferens]|nr:hypothetical protein JL720_14031 [Aureococcus anophagefferens]
MDAVGALGDLRNLGLVDRRYSRHCLAALRAAGRAASTGRRPSCVATGGHRSEATLLYRATLLSGARDYALTKAKDASGRLLVVLGDESCRPCQRCAVLGLKALLAAGYELSPKQLALAGEILGRRPNFRRGLLGGVTTTDARHRLVVHRDFRSGVFVCVFVDLVWLLHHLFYSKAKRPALEGFDDVLWVLRLGLKAPARAASGASLEALFSLAAEPPSSPDGSKRAARGAFATLGVTATLVDTVAREKDAARWPSARSRSSATTTTTRPPPSPSPGRCSGGVWRPSTTAAPWSAPRTGATSRRRAARDGPAAPASTRSCSSSANGLGARADLAAPPDLSAHVAALADACAEVVDLDTKETFQRGKGAQLCVFATQTFAMAAAFARALLKQRRSDCIQGHWALCAKALLRALGRAVFAEGPLGDFALQTLCLVGVCDDGNDSPNRFFDPFDAPGLVAMLKRKDAASEDLALDIKQRLGFSDEALVDLEADGDAIELRDVACLLIAHQVHEWDEASDGYKRRPHTTEWLRQLKGSVASSIWPRRAKAADAEKAEAELLALLDEEEEKEAKKKKKKKKKKKDEPEAPPPPPPGAWVQAARAEPEKTESSSDSSDDDVAALLPSGSPPKTSKRARARERAREKKAADELAELLTKLDLKQHARHLRRQGVDFARAKVMSASDFVARGFTPKEATALVRALAPGPKPGDPLEQGELLFFNRDKNIGFIRPKGERRDRTCCATSPRSSETTCPRTARP